MEYRLPLYDISGGAKRHPLTLKLKRYETDIAANYRTTVFSIPISTCDRSAIHYYSFYNQILVT